LAVTTGLLPGLAHAGPEPVEPEPQVERTEAELALEAANAAASKGDYETALEHYERARELDPQLDIDEALAMSHFEIGTKAYATGEYESALRRFQDAQGLYPSPNFHYNIGQCYEALERPQQAIDSYSAFLRAVPDTPDRANIENKIARLKKRIEDEKEAGTAETPTAPPPGRALIASGAVLTGLGSAVAIGGGLGFGLRALERSDQVDQVFEDGNPDGLTLDETERLDEQGRKAQTRQIITMAAGGAVAAVGITLLALGIVEKRRAGKLETAGPLLGPGLAGVSLSGRF
jgi:tetratricopeptide (TPR) repeat protein